MDGFMQSFLRISFVLLAILATNALTGTAPDAIELRTHWPEEIRIFGNDQAKFRLSDTTQHLKVSLPPDHVRVGVRQHVR